MKYNQPFGVADANAPYVDRNTPGAVSGSVPPAAAIEHPMREIVNAITAAGITPDGGNLTQLAEAIRETRSKGALIGVKIFDASGTYVPSPGTRFVRAFVTGAGGGGGTVNSGSSGFGAAGGGGGGGTVIGIVTGGFAGAPVIVGAGAIAGAQGGQSSFMGLDGDGGRPGLSVTASTAFKVRAGGVGGGASGGYVRIRGEAGNAGLCYDAGNVMSGFGGRSYFGAGGSAVINDTLNGDPGVSKGGGGGGAAALVSPAYRVGGKGADGIVIIEEYA